MLWARRSRWALGANSTGVAIDRADAKVEESREAEGQEPRGTRQPWRRPPGRERSSSPDLQASATRASPAWSPPSTLEQLGARDRSVATGLLERLQYVMLDGVAEHEARARLAENAGRSEATVRRRLTAQAWGAIEGGQERPAELNWLATRAVRWEGEAERPSEPTGLAGIQRPRGRPADAGTRRVQFDSASPSDRDEQPMQPWEAVSVALELVERVMRAPPHVRNAETEALAAGLGTIIGRLPPFGDALVPRVHGGAFEGPVDLDRL